MCFNVLPGMCHTPSVWDCLSGFALYIIGVRRLCDIQGSSCSALRGNDSVCSTHKRGVHHLGCVSHVSPCCGCCCRCFWCSRDSKRKLPYSASSLTYCERKRPTVRQNTYMNERALPFTLNGRPTLRKPYVGAP